MDAAIFWMNTNKDTLYLIETEFSVIYQFSPDKTVCADRQRSATCQCSHFENQIPNQAQEDISETLNMHTTEKKADENNAGDD